MQKEIDDLLSAWRSLDSTSSPFLLNGDKSIMFRYFPSAFYSYSNFYQNVNFGLDNHKRFHTGLIPVPYVGDLLNSEIYLLMLNPGFAPNDYLSELYDADFRSALCKNLIQELDKDYPNLTLNPRFAWHGGAMYWMDKLNDILLLLSKERGISFHDSLKILSKKICIIESLPYHSSTFPLNKNLMHLFESSNLIKRFVNSIKQNPKKTIIVLRNNAFWNLEESKDSDRVIVYKSHEPRMALLNRKSRGGRKIAEVLGHSFP